MEEYTPITDLQVNGLELIFSPLKLLALLGSAGIYLEIRKPGAVRNTSFNSNKGRGPTGHVPFEQGSGK